MSDMATFILGKINQLNSDNPHSKAMLAKLRNSIGKPLEKSPDIWNIILSDEKVFPKDENIRHVVLSLYALHKQGKSESMHLPGAGIGISVRKLISNDNEEAIRRRFNAMATAQTFEDMIHHARGMIQLFKTNDIKLDYVQFARDLQWFDDRTRLKWGRDFYRQKGEDGNEQE